MTAPANTQPLPFVERIQLAKKAIEQRVQEQPISQASAFRARLWCQLLRREVLS